MWAFKVRIRYDLTKRHARAVIVYLHIVCRGYVAADMHNTRRIFFNLNSFYCYFFDAKLHRAVIGNRNFILSYLEVLSHIWVEIGFTREERRRGNFAFQCHANKKCEIHGTSVNAWLASRQSDAVLANVCVRLLDKSIRTSTEKLCLCVQLHMNF